MAPPKKGKKGEGFHSAAGLIRYFDAEEETAVKIDPRYMLVVVAVIVIVLEVLNAVNPM
ncbi:MAG: preprotein translocase subunit Sec61beta [Candidatus Thermoplasmatota archaeon]|jgi:preprotein translocase subunit Sec61beta|nr:preprotein translocase subunit Sec61beta [Candidatus Thermoplasmatota archaeon]MDP7265597.1 preprotein translocase subunit Sec61beta [Candidatus Thermoplasmatota archaeon]